MRPTKKFKVPSGKEIEIYTYTTGGEYKEIQNIMLKDTKISAEGDIQDFRGEVITDAQDRTIEMLVVKVDGKDGDILKLVSDLPLDDFNVVIGELNKISMGLKAKKKEN